MRHTAAVAVALVAMFVASAATLPFMTFAEGLEAFYDREHPRQAVLDRVENEFVHGRWLFITVGTDDVFKRARLEQIRSLSNAVRDIKLSDEPDTVLVEDVLSLTTTKTAVGAEDTFRSVDLVADPI